MNQRVALTKRLIKESLLELLKDRSISRVTVVELCAHAGVNRSTFYAHYGSPQDVLREIGYDTAEAIDRLTRDRSEAGLKEQLLAACEYIYETRDAQRILIRNTTVDDIKVMMGKIPFESVFPKVLASGSAAPDKASHELGVVFLTSGIYNVVRHWILNEVNKTPAEVVDIVAAMISKLASSENAS